MFLLTHSLDAEVQQNFCLCSRDFKCVLNKGINFEVVCF